MKSTRRFAAGAMAILMAASMAAVARPSTAVASESSSAASSAAASESSGNKLFRFATSTEPTTLDPTKGNSVADNEVQRAITEGLVRTIDGEINPAWLRPGMSPKIC